MEEKYSKKLFNILKSKHSDWSDEKIYEKASQFAELGFFLVRQYLQQRSKHLESDLSKQIEERTREPPIQE